jgi:predicted phosphate transport protein (TIGR00153 family)
MNFKLPSLFSRTSKVERNIDDFFDKVVVAGLLFRQAMQLYMHQGICAEFEDKMARVEALESESDQLRREIETELYVHTLIPDLRSDVMSLLEDVDVLINLFEAGLFKFHIERPQFPAATLPELSRLLETVCECVELLITSARAFFRDIQAVRDHNCKVQLLETEADKLSTALLRRIFNSELDIAHKVHLRYFVERIDELANTAEDISDRLSIYAIKRRI